MTGGFIPPHGGYRKLLSYQKAVRKLCHGTHVSYAFHVEQGTPETAANTIVCLVHQANYLLDQQLRALEKAFVEEGGLRERMTRARLQERGRQAASDAKPPTRGQPR
jgi:four helix bundle suffix protein